MYAQINYLIGYHITLSALVFKYLQIRVECNGYLPTSRSGMTFFIRNQVANEVEERN